jgi:hypothetical protein
MKKQTAIQQAIQQIEQKAKYENTHIAYGMEQAVDILKGLLRVEREQHRVTHLQGVITAKNREDKDSSYTPNFDHYYLTTFENHKG